MLEATVQWSDRVIRPNHRFKTDEERGVFSTTPYHPPPPTIPHRLLKARYEMKFPCGILPLNSH